MSEETVVERIRRLKAEQAAAKLKSQPEVEVEEDYAALSLGDVPEREYSGYQKTPEDLEFDSFLKNLTIEEAFKKFIPKTWAGGSAAGKGEIMFRCPYPDHPDNKPSASYDPEDHQKWNCHRCAKGGDAVTIAAIGLGLGDNTKGENFTRIAKGIREHYGFVEVPRAPGQTKPSYVRPKPEQVEVVTGPPAPKAPTKSIEEMMAGNPQPEQKLASVTQISQAPSAQVELPLADTDANFVYPTLDWQAVVKPDTFLYNYMRILCEAPNPNEYDFWNGMVAIGLVLGRDVYIRDSKTVFGNLFVCTVGKTGQRKSTASYEAKEIIENVMPYEADDPNNNGVYIPPTPGSEVYLVHEFDRRVPDLANPAQLLHLPVKGLIEFSEFMSFASKGRSDRGGQFKTVLLQFYDNEKRITSGSMTNGKNVAIDSFCSLITTTQLKSIKDLMTEADANSGLLNRFVFSMGNSTREPEAFDDYMPDRPYLNKIYQEFKSFWALQGTTSIVHSPESKALFNLMWKQRGLPEVKEDDTGLLARILLTSKKVLLLLGANAQLKVFDEDLVRQTFIVLDYLLETYMVIGARIGVGKQSELEQAVLDAIKRYQHKHPEQSPTPREITLSLPKTKRMSAKDLRSVLDSLVAIGELQFLARPSGTSGAGNFGDRYRYAN